MAVLLHRVLDLSSILVYNVLVQIQIHPNNFNHTDRLMNTKNAVPYIIALFTFFDSLCFAAKSSESVPGDAPRTIA
jgi:hypothetical protein